MDSPYAHLLEKLRLPQPSFQRFAVISIFNSLRSASSHFNLASGPGHDALSRCLTSPSAAVADQSVRELCRLVSDGLVPLSSALVDLLSALEGCDPQFVPIFVKAIGFLCRLAFRNDTSWGRRFDPPESHPFIKVLGCRDEVQTELIRQVLMFITHNRSSGMEAVAGFLKSFLAFSILRRPSRFVRDLVSAMVSLSCSLPSDDLSIIKLLIRCLKYFPNSSGEEFKSLIACAEYLVDAVVVVLKQAVGSDELLGAAQACGSELLGTLLSLGTSLDKTWGQIDIVIELLKRLLVAEKALGLNYLPEFVMVSVSISLILTQVEFEHEHLSILKLLIFLVEWKTEKEYNVRCALSEELLFVFPVIKLLSSPSRSVKSVAAYLLSKVEGLLLDLSSGLWKAYISDAGLSYLSKPEFIPFRLLYHLCLQEKSPFPHTYFLYFTSREVFDAKETSTEQKNWTSQLREYLTTLGRQKFVSPTQSPENFLPGISMLLSSVVSILVMHPILGGFAVDTLADIGQLDPKLGMPLLLSVLFYSKMLCNHQICSPEILLRLLELLPSLASHSDMVQLIIQTILPLLQKDTKPMLYSSAVRLLCKTWNVSDRVFGTLQGILDTERFINTNYEREVYLSIAASIRDVCKHNPDRGVDLIVSISSCIESRDSAIQALGFESLAHLCEADVVDFYTAWNVVAKHTVEYILDPILARGLCTLLRWGAMDAEAYPEASQKVLQVLWEVATTKNLRMGPSWVKARVSAFNSLSHYEVLCVRDNIHDFKRRNFQCLTSEENADILKAMEGFEVKIINFEYTIRTRHRVHKEKRVMVHKVEKLLEVFPQALFSSVKQNFKSWELPGAALLSLVFTPKELQSRGASKDYPEVHAAYKNALKELADSLHVPRNILVVLLALQSWKSFIQRWMRALVFADKTMSSDVSDKSSKVASDILKTLCAAAKEDIPRVAVNIILAIAALCLIVPPSADTVFSDASSFLLSWLFEYGHEYKQWSAAVSLGLVSNCFHATDRNQKFAVVTALIKVLCNTKSILVKGACGVGLGFACQDLLTRVEYSSSEGSTNRITETKLLLNIIQILSITISNLCPSTLQSLRSLNECLPLDGVDTNKEICSDLPRPPSENSDYLEEDTWGVAGLVLGLGNSVEAIYRLGAYDAVVKIKDVLISWIPRVDSSSDSSFVCKDMAEVALAMGSCLVLPAVVAFCQRTELVSDDLDVLYNCYVSLVSVLLNSKRSGTLNQNLLMTSCVGAGSFLACIMNDGVKSKSFDDVRHLLEILRSTYTNPYHPAVHLGGMLGVVNAFGAGAMDITHSSPLPIHHEIKFEQESSNIRGPLLSSSICETLAASMVQEIFLVAKDSKDMHIQRHAAWALSFLRCRLFSEESQNVSSSHDSSIDLKAQSQNFTEDNLVWTLCMWLSDVNSHKSDGVIPATTVVTVLRCLSKAPRLLTLDWGVIMRNCLRYEAKMSDKLCTQPTPQLLREESIYFSIAHAKHVNSLLLFLDELTDLPRFRTLELNMQSTLLEHLSGLLKYFSGLRLVKLFEDLAEYFSSSSSPYFRYELDQKSLLRISFWKGFHRCLVESFTESIFISTMEKCMEQLFSLLPALTCNVSSEKGQTDSVEWSEAIRCLCKARQEWLIHLLQVPENSIICGGSHSVEEANLISARARLIRCGCFPISQFGKIKACILNTRSQGIWWSVLVEVAAAVSAAGVTIRRQWLLDALEISCISEYPSTAIRFVGLLAGNCSKYMPLLIVDPTLVLSDLPVTLTSLLSEGNWSAITDSVVDKLWASTERICNWAIRLTSGDGCSNENEIHTSEACLSALLARVMHQTCVSLKDYLPFEKQFRLANMEIP